MIHAFTPKYSNRGRISQGIMGEIRSHGRTLHENLQRVHAAQNGRHDTRSNGRRPWAVLAINLLFNLMSRIGPRSAGR